MAANPFDQFDAPAQAANPFDQFDAKAPAAPSDNDYSHSPLSAVARTFESSADWGTGDLLRAAMTGKKPSETAAQSSAAAASLPWYVRYPTEAVGYGLGLVNLLDPVTDAAEAGAAGLGAGAALSKIAGTAAEGATVGGVSHVAGSDDPGITDTAGAALSGGAVGGAAGAAVPLVNKGLTKAFGKPGSIDPDAAIAAATQNKRDLYDSGKQIPIQPTHADNAFSNVLGDDFEKLDPSEATDLSDSFMKKIKTIRDAINTQGVQGNDLNANQVDSWRNQVFKAASSGVDTKVAAQIGQNLDGVLNANGATEWNNAAKNAFKQQENAKTLKTLGQKAEGQASFGDIPLTQANAPWNQDDPAAKQAWMNLYKQGQDPGPGAQGIGHMAAGALGDIGGAIFGFPGHFAGEALGYFGLKPQISKFFKGKKYSGLEKTVQQSYPGLTGQPLTGAQPGPQIPSQVGDQLKNLALGGMF